MYTIGKPAEFDDTLRPVRGQCQPHTKGWQLKHVQGGVEEVLHEDSYYTCRELQKAVGKMGLEEARTKIKGLAETIAVDLQETQKMPAANAGSPGVADETPIDLPTVGQADQRRQGDESTEVIRRDSAEQDQGQPSGSGGAGG